MTEAVPAHGTLLEMEADPTGMPGVFTEIAEIIEIDGPHTSREQTETTPHNATISQHTSSGRLLQGPISLGLNYLNANATHDAAAGLKKALYDNETRGYRFVGPGGMAGVDEFIVSGKVMNFVTQNPVRSGQRQATLEIQPSGLMIDDGVIQGTIGT